jgi:hypothetical protein
MIGATLLALSGMAFAQAAPPGAGAPEAARTGADRLGGGFTPLPGRPAAAGGGRAEQQQDRGRGPRAASGADAQAGEPETGPFDGVLGARDGPVDAQPRVAPDRGFDRNAPAGFADDRAARRAAPIDAAQGQAK